MLRRLLAIAISILLTMSLPPVIAGADGMGGDDGSDTQRTRRHDMIWEGLCVGASLDLSFESQVQCAKTAQQAANNGNSAPPSIATGLCVGASLDLSRASELRCARQVDAAQQSRRAVPPNIEAGLCVGASLDLSLESQIKCTVATRHSTSSHHPKDHVGSTATTPPPVTPPTPQSNQYAALGDSVAAGLGLTNPASSDSACGRSLDSYPYLVASSRGLTVSNLACKGATMGDLITEQGMPGPNPPAQVDTAFASGQPQLITITAGANDVHWEIFLRKCYRSTCGTDRDERVASVLNTSLGLKTQAVFQAIRQHSNGSPPEVILTGYYQSLSDACAQAEPRLTAEELAWIERQTNALNQTLENAANQSGFVKFVPVDFSGHDICSNDPWVQTLNDPAPFHPNASGQQAIAQAIN